MAVYAAATQRLICDGRHLNGFPPEYPCRMETLHREGRALLERPAWGGSCDLSSAFHHIQMHPGSVRYLGFESGGSLHGFTVLRFGPSSAPWLCTKVMGKVMGHCVRFLR